MIKIKPLFLTFALVLATVALAQEATLQTPVPRPSEAKYRVHEVAINAGGVIVTLQVRDSSESPIRNVEVIDSDASAFLTAMDTVRPTETGGVLRRMNFRILGRLADASLISGVTLVP